jgi:hypothetical protein
MKATLEVMNRESVKNALVSFHGVTLVTGGHPDIGAMVRHYTAPARVLERLPIFLWWGIATSINLLQRRLAIPSITSTR